MTEQVFVVDRSAFFHGDWPQGFHSIPDPETFLERAWSAGRFVPRPEAEANPDWKQWIPYCMLRCGSWDDDAATDATARSQRGVLVVRRTKKGGETRLHESLSIGLGGHVEPEDQANADAAGVADGTGFFATALWRELTEELRLPTDTNAIPRPRLLGLINDDSTEVGSVHAGLAYSIDIPAPIAAANEAVGIREISKLRGAFTSLVDFEELWLTRSQFESWSQFLIQAEIVGAMGGRSWRGTEPIDGPDSVENETGRES